MAIHHLPGYEGEDDDDPDYETTAEFISRVAVEEQTLEPRHPPAPRGDTLVIRWIDDITVRAPEPPELIEGLLRAGEFAVLVAPRKLGKSWFAMQLAIALARGEGHDFLGRLRVKRKARVLLAQGELDQWASEARWDWLTAGDGKPVGIAESFDRWRIRTEKVRSITTDPETGLNWTSEFYEARIDDRLERTIVENQIDVLIIDPWAVFFSGSENSNDEVEVALGRLRDLAMRTGVAIVIVHHISKVGLDVREPEDLWRGASRLADWASTGITMLPHYKTERAWLEAGLTRQEAKRYADLFFMRRSTPTPDFPAMWDVKTGHWSYWPEGESDGAPKVGKPTMNPIDVAEACKAAGGSWPSQRAAVTDLGQGSKKGPDALELAVRVGLIETFKGPKSAIGYRLTGRSAMDVEHGLFTPDPDDPGPSGPDDDEPERF